MHLVPAYGLRAARRRRAPGIASRLRWYTGGRGGLTYQPAWVRPQGAPLVIIRGNKRLLLVVLTSSRVRTIRIEWASRSKLPAED